MESSTVFIGFLLGLLLYYLYYTLRCKWGKSIPGPLGIPVLGFIPFLRNDAFRQLHEMSNKYGKMFKVQVGTKDVIVLNDWTTINEAFNNQREVFSGRPKLFTINALTGGTDITSQDSSPAWKVQRKFAQTTLREMGVGRSIAEIAVEEEVEKCVQHLANYSGKLTSIENMFFYPVVNIIWNITSGEKLEYDHQDTRKFGSWFHILSEFMSASNIMNFFPAFRYFSQFYQEVQNSNDNLKVFLKRSISDHQSAFVDGNEPKDYIEAYLQKMEKNTDLDNKYFDDVHMLADAYVFLHAGTETTANTLAFSVIYMSVWPDIQTKVQREIDETLGKSKVPQYSDRQRLPYAEAVLLEVQRFASVVPFAIPHMTKSATKLFGYDIPANMTIWPNLWALHHDPGLWGDPEVFRPERFIDSEGKITKPEYLIPFSVGARRCIGEDLAKVELFMFFTTLMQQFTFRCPVGHPPPSLDPDLGVTLRPKPYLLSIEKRHYS